MRSGHPSREAGFTVVEMLVAVSIMVMVTIPILMVLQSSTATEAAQTARIDADLAGNVAAERLSADIRSATTIRITTANVLELGIIDTSGTTAAVTWKRDNTDLVRTSTIGAQTTVTAVLDDLSTTLPATPFKAYDQSGNRILTTSVNCPGYISVDIERVTTLGTDHLAFDVASRSLNGGTATC
ncbi:MAG: prepilin-type N-terminal cleavage/methylation domain-containing protein [Acidimicrobiales bacterium]